MTALLRVADVEIDFETRLGVVRAVRGVSFEVGMGDSVAIVGASGSGKTVLSRSLLGLVDEPGVVRGSIDFDGLEVIGSSGVRAAQGARHGDGDGVPGLAGRAQSRSSPSARSSPRSSRCGSRCLAMKRGQRPSA